MLIGVVSDTHGSLPDVVVRAFADCAHIIHAGDVGASSVIERLATIAPLTVVKGNCDSATLSFDLRRFAAITLGGVRFFVTHTPADAEASLRGRGFISAQQPLPQVCIHGHTHVPRNERRGAVMMLCPGSPVHPRAGNGPSVMLVEIEDAKVTDARTVWLDF
ncbi:MAG: metallophosphoesterase family protein [Coriobacteriaceae bacterium]|nr:metallophosphoesterase family protein [Coriobacteriaceae bacterium]